MKFFFYLSHGTNCLLDQTKRGTIGNREAQEITDDGKLPGQVFSLDEQCKHVYDERSYFCQVCLKNNFRLDQDKKLNHLSLKIISGQCQSYVLLLRSLNEVQGHLMKNCQNKSRLKLDP